LTAAQVELVGSNIMSVGPVGGSWAEAQLHSGIRHFLVAMDGAFFLTAGTNVRIWDVKTGANTHVIVMKPFTKVDCMFLSDQRTLWCGHSDGDVSCTRLVTFSSTPLIQPSFKFQAHKSGLSAILINAGNDIYTASDRGSVRVWPGLASAPHQGSAPAAPMPVELLLEDGRGAHNNEVKLVLDLAPYSRTVWSGCKHGVHVWDASGRGRSHRHLQHVAGTEAVCPSATAAAAVGPPRAHRRQRQRPR
jgi:WD40 repeat protein